MTAPRSAGPQPGPRARAVFRGAEIFHPKVGRFSSRLSGGWKKCFQALEKFGELFPRVGKIRRLFSRRWKFCEQFFRALEKMESVFPDVGRIPSKGWKKRASVFQTLEKTRPKFPDVGRNRSAGLEKSEGFLPDIGRPRRSAVSPGLARVWACGFCPAYVDEACSGTTEGRLPCPRLGRPQAGPQQRLPLRSLGFKRGLGNFSGVNGSGGGPP